MVSITIQSPCQGQRHRYDTHLHLIHMYLDKTDVADVQLQQYGSKHLTRDSSC